MTAPAAITVRVLGSGSRGNASLVSLHHAEQANGWTPRPTRILLDAGFSPRRVNALLGADGLGTGHLDAVVLTHADQDHFHPGWGRVVERHDLPLYAHRRHRSRVLERGVTGRTLRMFEDAPFELPRGRADVEADRPVLEPVLCAHDGLGSVGFVLEHRGARLGWATDLGRVPKGLLARFTDLDAVAIESNYDPDLQRTSDRPAFLKERIMGGAGHLANHEALDAVLHVERASAGALRHVVLLHLSRDCNRPELVEALWRERAGHLADRLVVTRQDAVAPDVRLSPVAARASSAAAPGLLFE